MSVAEINGAESIAHVLTDAAELVWNSFGVSSKIGRLAERVERRVRDLACLLDDPPGAREGRNRFSFEYVRHGQRLPHHMTDEQHRALARALVDVERVIGLHYDCESRKCGPTHRRKAGYWRRMAKAVQELRSKADDAPVGPAREQGPASGSGT